MRFLRLLAYEFSRMASENRIALVACGAFAVVAQLNAGLGLSLGAGPEVDPLLEPLSAGDILLFANQGTPPFDPATRKFFILDMVWAAPYLLLGYLACTATSPTTKQQSLQVISRTQSRTMWMVSKYTCLMIVALGYFGLEAIIAQAVSWGLGGTASLFPTTRLFEALATLYSQSGTCELALTYACIAIGLAASAILVFTFACILRPAIAYIGLVALITSSAYFENPVLFPGASMSIRSPLCGGDPHYAATSLVASIVILAASLIIGLAVNRKADFK